MKCKKGQILVELLLVLGLALMAFLFLIKLGNDGLQEQRRFMPSEIKRHL